MTYQQTIDYLFHVTPVFEKVGAGAYKEGLSNTWAMDEHFGHPHRQFKTIHVAGTNGKGSCSHTIAAILQSAGYKVGLYTSPHLVDFRERIRVNGLMVSEEYVIDFVENERAFFEPLHPSFFELTTAMAFKYFAEQHVDIAVIEVGLGGRLDCTNIITPVLSIITNISFDHTQFLGNTLAEITAEKAGIIKQGVPVVVGETTPETLPVFEAKAQEVHAPLHLAEQYEPDCDYDFELKGSYQDKNKRTILCAMHCLQELLEMEDVHGAIAQGMAHVCELTGLVGRWQTLRQQPLVVCDTGHNVGGWTYLSEQIKAQKCRQLRIVFGMVDDKDINTVMEMLPKDAVYYFTQASTHRAIPVGKVMEYATSHGLRGNGFNNVKDAYHQALQDASTEDFIFVGGSSYVVADLLAI
ncbi:MAG: bifunctional folylpolyglutamate synthase/dihydrofolate synthase [Prevotella sp.]|nr:bifunctional folylpolyglutamate synthase/dihydrofolate synthase [Prevotella sp.]